MVKLITWVDLQGRYRISSPSYGWLAEAWGFTEDDAINWVWTVDIVGTGRYGVTDEHPMYLVEDVDLDEKVAECCGFYFRWQAIPDANGLRLPSGAWEMDTDGRPKINMAKARGVQMDSIRLVRNAELTKKDIEFMKALEADDGSHIAIAIEKQILRDIPQTFDLTTENNSPEELKQKWPENLPKE